MRRVFRIVIGLAIVMSQAVFPIFGPGVSHSADVKQCTHDNKQYPPGSQVCISNHIHECGSDGRWMDLRRIC